MKRRNPHITPAPLTDEGRITVERGHQIVYRRYGSGSRTLVGLHGGPGVGSRYLSRLNEVLADDMQLVLYDQLGGGDADHPDDPSLWQIQRFVDELATVCAALDLSRVTLYGQSWGGTLAILFALEQPHMVDGLVLSNSLVSGPAYLLDIAEHRAALGAAMNATMVRHEQLGSLESPEYQAAVHALNARHLYRTKPFDQDRAVEEYAAISNEYIGTVGPAYALWGPHEFMGTGPQAFSDLTDRLPEIDVPALVMCGWYDEVSPERCSRPIADGIRDSEYVVFGQSSHMTMFENESESYLAVIRDFLQRLHGPAMT